MLLGHINQANQNRRKEDYYLKPGAKGRQRAKLAATVRNRASRGTADPGPADVGTPEGN